MKCVGYCLLNICSVAECLLSCKNKGERAVSVFAETNFQGRVISVQFISKVRESCNRVWKSVSPFMQMELCEGDQSR
jgi:hypothetical protein